MQYRRILAVGDIHGMERHDDAFRNADLSEKMRMFREGRKIANAEMVWLEGVGLEK